MEGQVKRQMEREAIDWPLINNRSIVSVSSCLAVTLRTQQINSSKPDSWERDQRNVRRLEDNKIHIRRK